MDDDDPRPSCLSDAPHDENITDHIRHFLGCIEIWDRQSFLEGPNHADPETSSERLQWKSDCMDHLRRIDFLRSALSCDPDEQLLGLTLELSGIAWRISTEFVGNIQRTRAWRARQGLRTGTPP
ncbi:Uu.00g108070.m01.CDS01 [Anthostomella pinea]|uniref:Uu.00g108070.m01.CDS01 n=1 Tax=Anthostomella pinea TaxID=933095 RepID=A0AAI8VFE9_9PEZI|nr:Uu.00g108070.m01.CDS01 [Anthostomella pinea]